MDHHVLRRAVIAIALSASFACREAADPAAVRSAVLSSDAYAALPALRLVDDGPVCATADDRCLTNGGEIAAVSDQGSVLFVGPGDRSSQVFLVDAATRVPRAIGRGGSGPGEYRLVWSLAFGPGGDVRVFDGMQRRLLRFGADGAELLTAPVEVPLGLFDGGFVAGELRFLGTDPAATVGDSMPVRIYAGEPGARAARALHGFPVRHPSFGMGDFRRLPPPFTPQARFALDRAGGLFHANGATLVIDHFDSSGVHDVRFGFDRPSREVTEADRSAELERLTRRVPGAMRAAIVENMRQAATQHPAITQVRALGDGSVWVRESPHAAGDSVSWVVFADPTIPFGRLVLPSEDRILGAHAGRILVARSGGDPGTPRATPSELVWARLVSPAVAGVPTRR